MGGIFSAFFCPRNPHIRLVCCGFCGFKSRKIFSPKSNFPSWDFLRGRVVVLIKLNCFGRDISRLFCPRNPILLFFIFGCVWYSWSSFLLCWFIIICVPLAFFFFEPLLNRCHVVFWWVYDAFNPLLFIIY